MQLRAATGSRGAVHIPQVLSAAAASGGHRPAISLLLTAGRQEQSFASVAQWAAKTAHWLQIDHAADPNTTVGIVGPAGWVPAVAALGAWWLGLPVLIGEDGMSSTVVVAGPGHDGTVTWGYAFDGSDGSGRDGFTATVQEFPDQPPAPSAGPDTVALIDGHRHQTQRDLLTSWESANGTAGFAGPAPWLSAVALRPLVTGRATVVLGPDVPREAAAGDHVATWL